MQSKISSRWTLILSTIILSIIFLSNDYIFYSSSSSNDSEKDQNDPKKVLFDRKIINLGLDLQGGKEFLLAPKLEDWLVDRLNSSSSLTDRNPFNDALEKIDSMISQDPKFVLTIDIFDQYLNEKGSSIPDLFDGTTKDELKAKLDESLNNNIEIIHKRIDNKGVTEPSIRKIGSNISVEIPGKNNIDRLEELITSSAKLTFNEIAIGPGSHDFASWHIEVVDLFRTQDWASSLLDYSTVLDEDFPFLIIEKDKFEDFKSEVKKIKRTEKDWFKDLDFLYLDASVYIESAPENSKFIAIIYSEPIITGDMIDQAYVSSDEKINTSYRVNLEMNDVGSEKWKTFTGNNINKFAPIIMDNEIISMPRINSEIPNGECYIDGFKTNREARHIKNQIK